MTTRQAEKTARVVSRQEILDRASRHLGLPTHADDAAAQEQFERAVFRIYGEMLLALARAKRIDLLLPMLRACRKTVAGRGRSARLDALAAFLASVDGVPTECLVLVAMYLLPTIAPWLPFKIRTPYPGTGLPHPSRKDVPSSDDLDGLCKAEARREEKPPAHEWESPDDGEPQLSIAPAQSWVDAPRMTEAQWARMPLVEQAAWRVQAEAMEAAIPQAADPDETVTAVDALIGIAKRAAKGGAPRWTAPNGLRSNKLRDHARFLLKIWTEHFRPPVELPELGEDPLKYGRLVVECAARSLGVPKNGIRGLFNAGRKAKSRQREQGKAPRG